MTKVDFKRTELVWKGKYDKESKIDFKLPA